MHILVAFLAKYCKRCCVAIHPALRRVGGITCGHDYCNEEVLHRSNYLMQGGLEIQQVVCILLPRPLISPVFDHFQCTDMKREGLEELFMCGDVMQCLGRQKVDTQGVVPDHCSSNNVTE